MEIKDVMAREVLDSRGNPTIEVDIITEMGFASAIVPSGASTGSYEALELRDKGKRYHGKGVLKAVDNVNKIIAKKIKGLDCTRQEDIDHALIELDGTENKSKLGGNAILAVSLALAKAGALSLEMPLFDYIAELADTKKLMLPIPQFNVINGGRHAGRENDIQEHMLMPVGVKNFKEALRAGTETYHVLKSLLKKKLGYQAVLLGDEGGFAPPIDNVYDRLELMNKAVEEAGYKKEIKFALDCAASEFFKDNKYFIGKKKYSSEELSDFYKDLCSTYKIISIEDGFAEDDWHGWSYSTKMLGKKIQIVGDDLLVTNVTRIKRAMEEKSCNSLLLKVNQIGTLTESIKAAKLAFENKWTVVVSHRSGETEDTFIADLVVGLAAGQSKFGAPARSERNAKYNQLLRIEEDLGKEAVYAGKKLF